MTLDLLWNTDVDLTLPAEARVDLLMNSGQGDIYTDFDVVLAPQEVKMNREEGERGFRVRLEKEVAGKINRGSAEFRFKTFNGDIFRKSNPNAAAARIQCGTGDSHQGEIER